MALCMVCYSAPATESCLLCGKRVCRGDYAGNGMCKGCAKGKKVIGYFSNIEEGAAQPEPIQEEKTEPSKPTGSKRYIQ